MSYTLQHRDGTAVVTMHDRLTFAQHQSFRAMMAALDHTDAIHWRFDLADLRFVDTTGVLMLMIARNRGLGSGIGVSFTGVRDSLRRVLAVVASGTMAGLHHSPEECSSTGAAPTAGMDR